MLTALGAPVAAEPTYKIETRIIHEFEENGETRVQEARPRVVVNGSEVEINEQRFDIQAPTLKNDTAQKFFNLMMEVATQQAGPILSQWKNREPLQLNIEIPNLKQKFQFEVNPSVEP